MSDNVIRLRHPVDGRSALALRPVTGSDERWLAEAQESGLSLARIGNGFLARLLGDEDAGTVPALALGDRERLLRALAVSLLGPVVLRAFPCPAGCGEQLEIAIPLARLDAALPPARSSLPPVRLLTAADLEAAAAAPDPAAFLAEAADPEGTIARAELAARLEASDPDADCRIVTACPACGAPAGLAIDALALVLEALAQGGGFLADLDTLARSYGWSEAEIVAMPRARRRRYAELARQQT
ncbi:MAG: hypothetical protein SNJ79_03150 [Sphingomonadaceae bacterium]